MIEQKIEKNRGFMEKARNFLKGKAVLYALGAALTFGAVGCGGDRDSCYDANQCNSCVPPKECSCSKPVDAPDSECSCGCYGGGKYYQTSYEPLTSEPMYDALDTIDTFTE